MIEKISESDLILFECLRNPTSCTEILFSDFDDLGNFSEKEYSRVRVYQYPFQNYGSLFCEDSSLTKKQNFDIKKGFSDSYILGGRLTGKSLIGLIVDVCLSFFNKTFNWGVVSSYDALHVRGVMEKILSALENHKILKLLKPKPLRSPCYKVTTENGCLLESVNDNLMGKNPGAQWFQKHVDINWVEEASFLTKQVTNKKLMAQSELGVIDRFSGMTTFPKVSPMGEIFYNLKNSNKIINLPSYANPTWNEEKDEAAILEFGGKNSVGYEVQILGKVVEAGDSVYDIERIRETYKKDVPIKAFEINKNNFYRYKEIIIVDRPSNADSVYICLDKGEGAAPTEIIVLFKINGIYKYEYNITNFKLSPDEDNEVVDFIVQTIKANVIGIDVTSGGGKAMFSHLAKKYPENVVGVSFNEKIDIDFAKDDKGNNIYDKSGKPQYQDAYVTDWSVQRLKHLFYNKKIQCLMDYKLDQQFDGIIVMKSGQRTIYGSKVANHLYQAWQVFAICLWNYEFKEMKPIQNRKPSLGTIFEGI